MKLVFAMYFFIGTLVAHDAVAATPQLDKSDPLNVGVFPRRGAQMTRELFSPLVTHLAKELGVEVKLVTTKDFESFWERVATREFDLVHYNQYHYVKSKKLYGYSVILKNEELGEDTIAGSIVVRKDSGITTLDALRDKKIVFGGNRSAMQSYIIATYLLRQAGLGKGDYIEAFSPNPPNAIFAPYYGQAAAGGVGEKVLKLPVVTTKIDVDKLTMLAVGEQLPQLPWAVSPNVSASLSKRIQDSLATLSSSPHGKRVLTTARLTSLNVSSDEDFDKHREIIWHVLNEDYCVRNCNYEQIRYAKDNPTSPIRLGIFPRRPANVTQKIFTPLAQYLSSALGRPVEIMLAKDFEKFWTGVSRQQYDIVHLNQYQYVKAKKLYNYNVILKNEEHRLSTITPSIVVARDAPYKTLKDLKGKRIMFGGNRTAMISYIAATQLLTDNGLHVSDYVGEFTVIPTNTCKAVVLKQADACSMPSEFFTSQKFSTDIDKSRLRIVARGEPLAQLAWAVRGDMDKKLRDRIQRLLSNLDKSPAGHAVLDSAMLTGLHVAADHEYDRHRKIIKAILNEAF